MYERITSTSCRYCVAQWGVWASQGVCVPLFIGHPASEWEYILQDSAPEAVLVPAIDESLDPALQKVMGTLEQVAQEVTVTRERVRQLEKNGLRELRGVRYRSD